MANSLTPQQRAELRAALKRRFKDLWEDVQQELSRFNHDLYQRSAGEVHDLEDEATADVIVDVSFAEVHRDIGEMRDIDAALLRMTDGRYGVCSDCGSEIAVQRLHAYPTAQRCQPCQRLHELTYRRETGPTL